MVNRNKNFAVITASISGDKRGWKYKLFLQREKMQIFFFNTSLVVKIKEGVGLARSEYFLLGLRAAQLQGIQLWRHNQMTWGMFWFEFSAFLFET